MGWKRMVRGKTWLVRNQWMTCGTLRHDGLRQGVRPEAAHSERVEVHGPRRQRAEQACGVAGREFASDPPRCGPPYAVARCSPWGPAHACQRVRRGQNMPRGMARDGGEWVWHQDLSVQACSAAPALVWLLRCQAVRNKPGVPAWLRLPLLLSPHAPAGQLPAHHHTRHPAMTSSSSCNPPPFHRPSRSLPEGSGPAPAPRAARAC